LGSGPRYDRWRHGGPSLTNAFLRALPAVCLLASASAAQTPVETGRKALDLLLAEKYTDLSPLLAPSARDTLTPAFLRDRAGVEIKSFGTLNKVSEPVTAKDGKNTLISFPVQFSKVSVGIQFTLNEAGQIAALFFRPGNALLPPLWKRPAYSHPEWFHEREVTIGADAWKLGGTLSIPNSTAPFPAVLLVHGPGPNDRDETIYSNKIFADLAEGLASRGVAVLRYDKRTKIYGPRMGEMDFTVQQETIEDALRAIALLRHQPEIDPNRIFALGHSLGGYLAPRIAAQDGKLAGLIFLAANARPIEVVALEQNEYVAGLDDSPTPEAVKRLAGLRAEVAKVKALDASKPGPPIVMGLPRAYLLDLKTYDPFAIARSLPLPLLFLHGERDFQVSIKEFVLWKSAFGSRPNATFHSYPALNHLFLTGDGKGSPAEYREPGNFAPQPLNAIATWLLAQKQLEQKH
jgi:uncharacterized protein